MDENKSPQDILNEIFERTEKTVLPPPISPERPAPDEPVPVLPPDGPKEPGAAERLLPWLCLVLGAAMLVMGVCLLQLVRVNHRLDELRQAMDKVTYIDQLQNKMDLLQAEQEGFQRTIQALQDDNEDLRERLDSTSQERNIATIQKWQRDYLFYIGWFMDCGEYPMAAMAAALSADRYFSADTNLNVPPNPAQLEQYQAYRQELVDKGYLEQTFFSDSYVSSLLSVKLSFTEPWDPEQDPDMAALGILWCAMNEHYVVGNTGPAAQYLVRYQDAPLGDDGTPFPQRLRDSGSDEIVWQYELLVNALIADGQLVTTDDGTLNYSPELVSYDVLYGLPFDPPINTALIKLN